VADGRENHSYTSINQSTGGRGGVFRHYDSGGDSQTKQMKLIVPTKMNI